MCGIAGIYNFTGELVLNKQLELMNSRMIFRGPDDDGYFISDNFGMSMRRLAIIDLKTGSQPISYEKADLHIICNGEIYNFIELRKELELKRYHFKTNSDTEVLLYLYLEYGENFIKHVNGIFSFAIYDNKEKKLLIYRDRLGVKPLYYYLDDKTFIFSSNLDSILKLEIPHQLDTFSIFSYLINNYVPGENSINQNIKKLLPGNFIRIKNNKLSINNYWNINAINRKKINNFENQFEETLVDAVNIQSRTDVKIGSFLSGGVDSSVLTFLLNKKKSEFETYTTDFIGKQQEDLKYAEKISKELNLENKVSSLNISENFEKYLDKIIYFLDEPISDTAIIPSFYLSKLANQNNTKVIITGAGGDELFGGYNRHYPKQNIRNYFPNINLGLILSLASFFKKDFFNYFLKLFNNQIDFVLGASGINFNLLNNLIKDEEDFYSAFKKNIQQYNTYSYSFDSQKDLLKIDMINYLPDNILSLTDKMTMSSSVEARVPFLDHRLIELVISHDDDEFYGNKIQNSKKILKKIFSKKIKTNIWDRKKEGFNAPSNTWIYNNKDYLFNYFSENMHPKLEEIINKSILKKKILKIKDTKDRNIHSIFSLFLLNKWMISRYV